MKNLPADNSGKKYLTNLQRNEPRFTSFVKGLFFKSSMEHRNGAQINDSQCETPENFAALFQKIDEERGVPTRKKAYHFQKIKFLRPKLFFRGVLISLQAREIC